MVVEAEQELKIWVSKVLIKLDQVIFKWTENSVNGYLNERKLTPDINESILILLIKDL